MVLEYRKSESSVYPELIDAVSSNTVVYLRRGVSEKRRVDENTGEVSTLYEYEEAKLTKDEYKEYVAVAGAMDARQMRADIDYLLIMTSADMEAM